MRELTPMLKQYFEVKEQYPDELLMFRLGDFYELFGEDARKASKILEIVLTARNKGKENEIPMCGVPYHALENYLVKLINANHRVAICDQVGDPSGPGLVKRQVSRLVTPGTTLEDLALQSKKNNYIVSVVNEKNEWGLAAADLTTGEFKIAQTFDFNVLRNEIFRFAPSELILGKELSKNSECKSLFDNFRNQHIFDLKVYENQKSILLNHFHQKNLQSYGVDNLSVGISAGAKLLGYLKETQKVALDHITKITRHDFENYMVLDESTIHNLELLRTAMRGEFEGSLLSVIDSTLTNMGGRMLRRWLLQPLKNKKQIEDRHATVEYLKNNRDKLSKLQTALKEIPDLERILGKLGCRRANARDIVSLKNGLTKIPEIKAILLKSQIEIIEKMMEDLGEHQEICDYIEKVFKAEPAVGINEGDMIADGFNEQLDELRKIARGGKDWLAEYQAKEVTRTGINSLKVKYNKVFGYYIEISKANLAQAPQEYIRKQTLVNAERFITPELKEYEDKILGAEDKIINLERQIFIEAVEKIGQYFKQIQIAANNLATLDALAGFAQIAWENDYCRPHLNETGQIKIKSGRHPVIEKIQKEKYVPNDLQLNEEEEFLLITGPNMSGKSSYLRQTALICLMSQIGCFVPAEEADLAVLDRIFTRVGASDNLADGSSTFMVEMQEAANILNNATSQSLIILDELGRGTSTYDGLSIAWALIEHIHENIRAKTMFATHYHELTELVEQLPHAVNYCVAVSENQGQVVFLHKIVKGATSESYGIEVAKLAGLPLKLINRANQILKNLEAKTALQKSEKKIEQKSMLFNPADLENNKILDNLKQLEINDLTPLEALKKLSEIKDQIED